MDRFVGETVVMVSQVYTNTQTQKGINFKYLKLFVCHVHLNKIFF